MRANNFAMESYLARIGFGGSPAGDLDTLTALMQHQLQTIPFENLDVQAGRPISLEPEVIFDKLIHRRRGGYCYELNGLFAMVLEALGVPYRLLGARPMVYAGRRPRTHMVLLVTLADEPWLFDLGFGNYGIRAPIALGETDQEIRQGFDSFMLHRAEEEYRLQALVEGEWHSQYSFDLSHQEWIDFMPANYLNSTHPDSFFTRQRVVLIQRPEGRAILFGDRFKQVERGESSQRTLDPAEISEVLREQFGLSPD